MLAFFTLTIPFLYSLFLYYFYLILTNKSPFLIFLCGTFLTIEASVWYESWWPTTIVIFLFYYLYQLYKDMLFITPFFFQSLLVGFVFGHWMLIEQGLWGIQSQGYTFLKICCILINIGLFSHFLVFDYKYD
jgi:hypothetical protein